MSKDDDVMCDRLLRRHDRMVDWLMVYAVCPCCEGIEACDDECTFADDCPESHERMIEVRKILFDDPTNATPAPKP